MTGYGLADLGHLHEGQDAFLHAGPTRSDIEHYRQALGCRQIKEPNQLLPHGRPHGSHDEAAIHDA